MRCFSYNASWTLFSLSLHLLGHVHLRVRASLSPTLQQGSKILHICGRMRSCCNVSRCLYVPCCRTSARAACGCRERYWRAPGPAALLSGEERGKLRRCEKIGGNVTGQLLKHLRYLRSNMRNKQSIWIPSA